MAASWEVVREEWAKAGQMGYQSVLQAAKVGQMLIELKARCPHHGPENFQSRLKVELPTMDHDTRAKVMTLARNVPLLEAKQPDTRNVAIALISAENPKPKRAPKPAPEPEPEEEPEHPATKGKAKGDDLRGELEDALLRLRNAAPQYVRANPKEALARKVDLTSTQHQPDAIVRSFAGDYVSGIYRPATGKERLGDRGGRLLGYSRAFRVRVVFEEVDVEVWADVPGVSGNVTRVAK